MTINLKFGEIQKNRRKVNFCMFTAPEITVVIF